ncbi:DUF6194 family protein [Streptomyces sp. NRRL B-24484]|uniref:DUF6194 family protein n=1 Tax=Streptomyces sp. NRRL B-24484 TaxID=1463833 RepID=UPI0004BFA5A6|nr:DUF6194 family protein [Streptomyces sp. NRRL B-24484]
MDLTTENGITAYVRSLPGVVAVTADAAGGAPEAAWGDTFFFHDPDGDSPRRMPFATLVTKDYAGFDTASELDRPGVFRLNVSVGKAAFEELIGHPPAAHQERQDAYDHTATDRLLPHPAYAVQGWVCILNPGPATADLARSLLADAHARAARGHRRSG